MTKENEELKKRMSGVEEMVANLIVDQQAMAKAFQERGDRHSGSLERHRADLNTARKDIVRATLLFSSQRAAERLLALSNPCWSLPVGCPWFTEVESKALLPYTPLKVKIWR